MDPQFTAFVFPGQGSQALGMGRDLGQQFPVAKETFQEADDILNFSLSRLMWAGPEAGLNDTVNTQPALFVHSLAVFRVVRHFNPDFKPAAVAGHSLGELSALAAADAVSFSQGLRLVRTRGELMKHAGDKAPGGMAAILNLDIPTLELVCAQASAAGEIVQVANDNCPGQVVISGDKTAVERAIEGAKAAGAKRAIPLAVSIAAHSPLMNSIQAEWDTIVDACQIKDPAVPVISNVYAKPMKTAGELRADIKAQMQSRVRWTESIQAMTSMGIKSFVEVGNGNVLVGLIRRIEAEALGVSLGDAENFELF